MYMIYECHSTNSKVYVQIERVTYDGSVGGEREDDTSNVCSLLLGRMGLIRIL